MNESWRVIEQPSYEASWETPISKSNNLQAEGQPTTGNWGGRPAASSPSENNLNVKKPVPWGPNKSENSWDMRNDDVQVDRSAWQREEPPIPTSYRSMKRENDEEKLDSLAMQVGIQQSYESLKNDDFDRQKNIELDEDEYDPSYDNFPTSSKQLNKSIVTPFDDEIQFNNTSELPKKEFRNVGVQTDPINLAAISASNEKLLSCTISSQIKKEYQQTSQDLSKSATSSVSEKRYPPQQPSLLDVDPDEVTSSYLREGTAAIPRTRSDSSSRGEVTQWLKPNSDSWDNKSTSVQNDSGNTNQRTSARNDNRGTVPLSIPVQPDSWDSPQAPRNDNRGTVPQSIPVQPDSWDSPQAPRNDNRVTVPQSIPVQPDSWNSSQTSTRNDNRGSVPQSIPVQPDSWDSPQTSTRNDNRGSVPQSIPVQPDSWDSNSQTRNDNRGAVPQSIPVQPDSWNSTSQMSAQNDNRRLNPQPTPAIPVEPDSWDSGSQQPSASGPDWTQKAAMFSKELGEKNEIKPWGLTNNTEQKVEDSYGTGASDSYYDNSSSSNRYGSRGCHNCGQEGHMARDCPDKKQGRGCHKCGKEGHYVRDCTEESGGSYGGGYGGGRTCHKCGKEGHIVRECTEESSKGGYSGGYGGGRTCHKCGKEGHMVRECTEESSKGGYSGGYGGGRTCHKCGKEGHMARDCKEDAYETAREDGGYGGGNCFRCKRPGHRASECTEEPERSREFNNSVISRPHKPSPFSNPEQPNISSQEAWEKLLKAAEDNESFDFKEALELYAKVTPDETFVSIEEKLRAANSNGRIIAFERSEIPLTKVLVDLQGNTNKKYVATPILGHPSRLPRTSGNRASNQGQNLEWLADSGFMVDDRSPVCFNCKQKGHITKDCPEPKREIEKHPYLTCQNCGSSDHMTKYCSEERRDYYAEARDRKATGSHKGGSMEYSAIDDRDSGYDGEDRKGYRGYGSSNQTCHNCNREGHMSRECPEPRRGGRKCNKCGEEGHISRECPSNSGGDYDRGNYNSSGGWQRDSLSRNNDRNATWSNQDKSGDNTWNKPRNDNNYQENSWNKPRGGNSSRGDYNQDNSYTKPRNDTPSQDNSRNKPRGGNSSRGDYNQDNSWNKPRNDNSSRGDNQDNNSLNKNRNDYSPQDNSWNKPRGSNSSQGNSWNKPKGGNSENQPRGSNSENQDNPWSKARIDDNSQDNSWNKPKGGDTSQRDDQPILKVESDSWDSKPVTENTALQNKWGYMTAEDVGWTKPKENITSASENYENGRSRGYEQRERTPASGNYDNRRGRSNDQRERTPAPENYDNRRGRGYEQRERTPATENYDNRRGRGYEQRERTSDYENRRGPRDERYNNKGPGNFNGNDANNKSGNLDDNPWW